MIHSANVTHAIKLRYHNMKLDSTSHSTQCTSQPVCRCRAAGILTLTTQHVMHVPYLFHLSAMIHGILPVQSTRPTVFFHNLTTTFQNSINFCLLSTGVVEDCPRPQGHLGHKNLRPRKALALKVLSLNTSLAISKISRKLTP